MRRVLALLVLLLPSTAAALSQPRQGPYVDVSGGLSAELLPTALGPEWGLSAGWWWGEYDDVYALGRYTALGLTLRQAWVAGGLRTLPQVEVRRGTDVLVVGYHAFLSAGPELGERGLGAVALIGGGAKMRFTPHVGLGVRVAAGVSWVDSDLHPRAHPGLYLEWSRPTGGSR